MQKGNGERIVFLDYLRSIAIVCVVIVHAAENVYRFNVTEYAAWTLTERIVMVGLFDLGRMSVPLFFFISGYLLLSRNYDDEKCCRFWRRNWLPLLTASSFSIFLVSIWGLWGGLGNLVMWKTVAKASMFVGPVPCGILWFLPVMVGLYGCVPVVAVALERFRPRTLMPPLGGDADDHGHPDDGALAALYGTHKPRACAEHRLDRWLLWHLRYCRRNDGEGIETTYGSGRELGTR